MDFIAIAIGIAVAGYFIGNGLKNFKNPTENPDGNGIFDFDLDDKHRLIKESQVYHYMGISKEDAKVLIKEHPDIPHIMLNGKAYYPKSKLKEWLLTLGE